MKSFMKKIMIGSALLFFGFSGCVFAMGGDTGSNQWISPPILTSGWGTSPVFTAGVSPLTGQIKVGTGSPATGPVLTFTPAAPNGWIVFCQDMTTATEYCHTASTTTTAATLVFQTDAGVATAPTAADLIQFMAIPY